MTKARTLYDKIWDDHLVQNNEDGTSLLYIDRHLVHEVTSPQAFEGLRMNNRKVRHPERTLAVVDHNVPTTDRSLPNPDPESAIQIAALAENTRISASNISTPSISARASCTLSAPNRALPCPA
jgi:3-isopropylmalate/(R)-2-methylmalate dehydratase large subunit